MTWIRTISVEQADDVLRHCYEAVERLYPPEYHADVTAVVRPDGGSDSVVAAHSLIPVAMLHAMSTFGALLDPELPLSRRQHEMIAAVVSAQNQCFY